MSGPEEPATGAVLAAAPPGRRGGGRARRIVRLFRAHRSQLGVVLALIAMSKRTVPSRPR